ncbi:Cytidylyltransferase [Gimesia maris]|nr:Cytidylyltransferase [Gimesia maris]
MNIDYIIPAKTSSQRVPNKNWRPFRGKDSLVDLVLEKLLNSGGRASD